MGWWALSLVPDEPGVSFKAVWGGWELRTRQGETEWESLRILLKTYDACILKSGKKLKKDF